MHTRCPLHAHKHMEEHLASVHDTNELHMFLHTYIYIDRSEQSTFSCFILKSPHVHDGKEKHQTML